VVRVILPGVPLLSRDAALAVSDLSGVSLSAVLGAAERRGFRWVLVLPRHVAFVADATSFPRLVRERKVLARFAAAVGDVVPRVVAEAPEVFVQLRERRFGRTGTELERVVSGGTEPEGRAARYREDAPITAAGLRLARELGAVLARLHEACPEGAPEREGLPIRAHDAFDLARAEEVLAEVGDQALLVASRSAHAWWRARPLEEVVVHGDPRMQNVFADPETGALRGLVDVDEVAVADRLHDLRLLHAVRTPFARAAVSAYADASGLEVSDADVARVHVLGLFTHVGWAAPGTAAFARALEALRAAVDVLAPTWPVASPRP
jgi:aminoglycoside phosphotransferase (APT) family kinase protein